ncbi:MAG: dihydrolipoamide acetyltransferase family protein, partial [Coriobacteriia bacterium]
MAQKLMMIALSPTMTEGTIATWRKNEGEAFVAGDLLCEVETDKASMDYEAPTSAVLLKILVPAGGKASVGQTIAIIGKAGEAPMSLNEPAPQPSQEPQATAVEKESLIVEALPEKSESPIAPPLHGTPLAPASALPSSPLARKIARELGVDIRMVRGSGPEGRVVEKDVKAFAEKSSAGAFSFAVAAHGEASLPPEGGKGLARPPSKETLVSGKRAVIAKRLSDSFFSAPHYYLKKQILAENIAAARAVVNAKREASISINSIIVKLAAMALLRHPEMNVFWKGDRIEQREMIDIGLAVALPDGLITPIVRDCAAKGILQIDAEFSALIEKAKGKGL